MKDLKQDNNLLIFDGAMGTMLQNAGLEAGMCPEILNITAPDKVLAVHKAYFEAGANILTTNTFGGNPLKLEEYKLGDKLEEINRKAVKLAQKAAGGKALVAASLGPCGRFVYPIGDLSFKEAYQTFKTQITALVKEKPDFIILETFSDMGEMRAAILAAKDTTNVPLICSLTFEKNRTLTGVSPASAALVAESLGVTILGANCSGGPQELLPIIEEMATFTKLPLIIQPNAGLPKFKEGQSYYSMGASEFTQAMTSFLPLGVKFLGSCCGSTPEFTASLKEMAKNHPYKRSSLKKLSAFASREKVVLIKDQLPPALIGERINPTARKKLRESIINGDYSLVQEEAKSQVNNGAHLIDLNVGVYGIDQKETMVNMIHLLQQNITAPLVIDNTDSQVIGAALEAYHGKALVNSINGDPKSYQEILPLIKRYGASVIGLALDEKGVPQDAQGRFEIARRIVEACLQHGLPKEDIYIDCLVMAVGTESTAALETLKALRLVKEKLGVRTALGVSNVSHGLPARKKLNNSFLAMAIGQGLDLAIINPSDQGALDAWQAASLLGGRDPHGQNFILLNSGQEEKTPKKKEPSSSFSLKTVENFIQEGSLKIELAIESLLAEGMGAQEIVDGALVPALLSAGNKFEAGQIYLPQLMLSAEAAQKAFALLENHFGQEGGFVNKGTIIIGTVKGDIHDIGKNLVAVMLKNNGYRVIDLGKNIEASKFTEVALKETADLVALSALMTTTMIEIPPTIEMLKKNLPDIKIIIGGAVITEDFASDVGADGFGKDAAAAVKLVDELLKI